MGKHKNIFDKLFPAVQKDIWHKQRKILGIKFTYKSKKPISKKIEYFKSLPINDKKILFFTFNGAYTCNPKYIAEEILKRNLPYELVWIVDKNILKYIDDFPKQIKLVMTGTEEEIEALGTTKIIVTNERRNKFLRRGYEKKEGQTIIQTWHGSLGIKCTGEERKDLPHGQNSLSIMDESETDYLTSNGSWDTEFFKRIFDNNGEILEVGHPRNDIFFKDTTEVKEKVYKALNIPIGTKIALYAPTFREDYDMSCYTLDYDRLKNAIEEKFGGDWVIVNRLHPRLTNLKNQCAGIEHIIDATNYSDMQELLAASDICITDYSSCIYDYILQYKPGFIFATDVEKYDNGRGLQYPLSQTPFPVATNNDEMVKCIQEFDIEKYKSDVKTFLDGKGCIEDGHASERVVDFIEKLLNK